MKKPIFILFLLLYVSFCAFAQSNITISIPEPNGINLKENDTWLLPFIQTQLTDNFSRYSPFAVIDRQNVNKASEEIALSYSETNEIGEMSEFGQFSNANCIAVSTLTFTGNSYSLSVRINDVEKNVCLCSYNNTYSQDQLNDGSAINTATCDLLTQLGIEVSAKDKEIITKGNSETINRQKNFSKGIDAKRRGIMVEAMNYLFSAADNVANSAYEYASNEINSVIDSVTDSLDSIKIENVETNEADLKRAWKKNLSDAETFYLNHPPLDIVYSLEPQASIVNADKKEPTVEIKYYVDSVFSKGANQTIKSLKEGLEKTKRQSSWGLKKWPEDAEWLSKKYFVKVDLYNTRANVIASSIVEVENRKPSNKIEDIEIDDYDFDSDNRYVFKNIKPESVTENLYIKIDQIYSFETKNSFNDSIPENCIPIEFDSMNYYKVLDMSNVRIIEVNKDKNRKQVNYKQDIESKADKRKRAFQSRSGCSLGFISNNSSGTQEIGLDAALFFALGNNFFTQFSASVSSMDISFYSPELHFDAFADIGLNFRPITFFNGLGGINVYGIAGLGYVRAPSIGAMGLGSRIGVGLDFGFTVININAEYTIDTVKNVKSDRFLIGLALIF